MGVPVLANGAVGDTDLLFGENRIGTLISDFSPQTLRETATKLPNLERLDKQEIRNVALKNFSLEKGIERYNDIYESAPR